MGLGQEEVGAEQEETQAGGAASLLQLRQEKS